MFMAILLVTVLVDDEDAAVDAKTVPVAAGRVSVFVPATAVGDRVICPDEEPFKVTLPIMLPPPDVGRD